MIVEVALTRAGPTEIRLADPDAFDSFKVVVRGAQRDTARLATALGDLGRIDDDGYAWLKVAEVVGLAGDRGEDPDWRRRFDAMLSFAGKHGWASDSAVRAHCDWHEIASSHHSPPVD